MVASIIFFSALVLDVTYVLSRPALRSGGDQCANGRTEEVFSMFSFFKRNGDKDTFQQRRKQQEVWKCVRRILDGTAGHESIAGEARAESRYNRCIPALLIPWEDERLSLNEPVYGITKDFSDNGVLFVSNYEFNAGPVLCGFWPDDPVFLLGEVRRTNPFGGGFWQTGVLLLEIVCTSQVPGLIPLAEQLLPQGLVPA
jgi:hypothetical protein